MHVDCASLVCGRCGVDSDVSAASIEKDLSHATAIAIIHDPAHKKEAETGTTHFHRSLSVTMLERHLDLPHYADGPQPPHHLLQHAHCR